MPRRPATSGYARIAQAEEEEDEYLDSDDDNNAPRLSTTDTTYAPIQPARQPRPDLQPKDSRSSWKDGHLPRRARTNSAVDIKAINARLEKWADEIASKFKLRKVRGKTSDEEKLEIHHSVFQAPDGMRPASAVDPMLQPMEDAVERMTKLQFDDVVESVKTAIERGNHPKMITQGSSGSYFARNSEGKVVGVFKPKDEEPYASKNPKWTKWIHRNLFPFFFGRACLIPNLSYISEAAAYVLDTRLQTNLVPYTDVVYFSSISFNYDYWDRRAYYRKRKPLPAKVGSLQVFLKGFEDANIFLKKHPWPDQATSFLRSASQSQTRKRRWAEECRPDGRSLSDDEDNLGGVRLPRGESQRRKGFWSAAMQLSLRQELEKLVILDYIMRNTDRGLDNWMIKIDEESQQASILADTPANSSRRRSDSVDPYRREHPMSASQSPNRDAKIKVQIGAIDNSLSWPWKHPDAWRSFPFGWLFLPVSLIGQPFTENTRQHFLPLLTSKQWWSETQVALRACFSQDTDFQERMFARQIAVMKGQAWNVVETLKTTDHGPLELTRRARVCVWDDLVDIPTVIPMKTSTEEMHRRQHTQNDKAEANARGERAPITPVEQYLIPPASPPSPEGSGQNRFNQPRRGTVSNTSERSDMSSPVIAPDGGVGTESTDYKLNGISPSKRSAAPWMRTRMSYEGPAARREFSHAGRRRNLSLSLQRVFDTSNDDTEGDLGYAVAEEEEGNRKKVIVERLETIKSKGPFFTWC